MTVRHTPLTATLSLIFRLREVFLARTVMITLPPSSFNRSTVPISSTSPVNIALMTPLDDIINHLRHPGDHVLPAFDVLQFLGENDEYVSPTIRKEYDAAIVLDSRDASGLV